MSHYQLNQKIKQEFKDVKLDDAIGLWKVQGLVDRLS